MANLNSELLVNTFKSELITDTCDAFWMRSDYFLPIPFQLGATKPALTTR
jgi:hypothetical protein